MSFDLEDLSFQAKGTASSKVLGWPVHSILGASKEAKRTECSERGEES